MKKLLKLAKDSAKKAFKKLREERCFFCTCLDSSIEISRNFYGHVIYDHIKKRSAHEIMERILIFLFLEDILKNGFLEEERNKDDAVFYQISKKYKEYTLSAIVKYSKEKQRYSLCSCFKNF